MNQKQTILHVLLAVLPLIVVGVSYSFMANQKRTASNAESNMNKCNQIFTQMKTLQQKPQLASDSKYDPAETTGLVEQAANSAGIRHGSILRITPQPFRRISKTAYKEKSTNVVLKGITLKQFVTMINTLGTNASTLKLKSITLVAPSTKDTGRKWNVEFVLSYLIFDPIKTK
jgi:hypothetical protein